MKNTAYLTMHKSKQDSQRGSVLIFSLVIMLIMTILALSGLNSSSLDEKISRNIQDNNRTFQAAESAASNQLAPVLAGNTILLATAMVTRDAGTGDFIFTAIQNYSVDDDVNLTSSAAVKYRGEATLTCGNSLSSEKENNEIGCQFFEFRATSTLVNSGAQATVSQGIIYQ